MKTKPNQGCKDCGVEKIDFNTITVPEKLEDITYPYEKMNVTKMCPECSLCALFVQQRHYTLVCGKVLSKIKIVNQKIDNTKHEMKSQSKLN